MKPTTECRASGGCELDDRIDHISGFNAFDLCTAENCTAQECGLPAAAQQCNQTSLICSDYYLGCASGEQAHAYFHPDDVGASDPDIAITISSDPPAVKWEIPPSALFPAAGARASRGVHSGECLSRWRRSLQASHFAAAPILWVPACQFTGLLLARRFPTMCLRLGGRRAHTPASPPGKYYWEVAVPGICAMVGVSNRDFEQNEYPGFDYDSWGYGSVESMLLPLGRVKVAASRERLGGNALLLKGDAAMFTKFMPTG